MRLRDDDGAAAPSVAVAIPVKDEEAALPGCLRALDAAAARWPGRVTIVAMANDCRDGSVALLAATRLRHADLAWRAVSMLPGARHAGWARRLAFDAAADQLVGPDDLLLSTDADTLVAPEWIARNAACLADCEAVAGRAVTIKAERTATGPVGRRRLDQLGRYYTLLDYVRAARESAHEEGWPRHYYEGGASIALRLGTYRRIGGAPTPSLAEDRALFDRVRRHGGRVRHPVDVRVFTSCRLHGRAPGGMADALAGWVAQDEDAPLHETYGVMAALDPESATADDQLTFRRLPAAIAEAQRLASRLRSAAPPQIQAVPLPPLLALRDEPVAQKAA